MHPKTPYYPILTLKHPLGAPFVSQKALSLSKKVDECKPLLAGAPVAEGGGQIH